MKPTMGLASLLASIDPPAPMVMTATDASTPTVQPSTRLNPSKASSASIDQLPGVARVEAVAVRPMAHIGWIERLFAEVERPRAAAGQPGRVGMPCQRVNGGNVSPFIKSESGPTLAPVFISVS